MAERQRDAFAQPAEVPWWKYLHLPDSVRRRRELRHARHRCQRNTSGERRPSAYNP